MDKRCLGHGHQLRLTISVGSCHNSMRSPSTNTAGYDLSVSDTRPPVVGHGGRLRDRHPDTYLIPSPHMSSGGETSGSMCPRYHRPPRALSERFHGVVAGIGFGRSPASWARANLAQSRRPDV